MKINRLWLAIPLSLALADSADAAAKHHRARHGHVAGGWDGTWSGAWGGSDPCAITIAGNKVVSYQYGGQTIPVHASHVTAKTVRYNGDGGAAVTVTRTGANTAHATLHSSQGDGVAEMTRK